MAIGEKKRGLLPTGDNGDTRRTHAVATKIRERFNLKGTFKNLLAKKFVCNFKDGDVAESGGKPNAGGGCNQLPSYEDTAPIKNESTATSNVSSNQRYAWSSAHQKDTQCSKNKNNNSAPQQRYKQVMENSGMLTHHRMNKCSRPTDNPGGGSISLLELPPNAIDNTQNVDNMMGQNFATGAYCQHNKTCNDNTRNKKMHHCEDNALCNQSPIARHGSTDCHSEKHMLRSALSVDSKTKPAYNSLCTKCMPEEDKITKGFTGLLIQTPIFNYVNEPKPPSSRDTTPTFDRSLLIHETALVDGMSINDVYELYSHRLGKGSYGQVLKACHRETGEVKAVKVIRKASIENAMRMKREISIMKTLDHPNIVKLLEVYEDEECLYLVMEMCGGGELFDEIVRRGCFSEEYAATVMRQIFSAVSYCHGKSILHRDLKPENILYANKSNDSPIKVIDWGFATKCCKAHKFHTLVGTPYYVAPEVLLGNYDKSCDIWSAGVILFIMLVGYPPFHGNDNATILKNVKRGTINFVPHHWKNISKSAIDLITRCLSYDPRYRITAKAAFNHEWILQKATSIYVSPVLRQSLTKDLVKRFQKFDQYNSMKRLALTCIAHHLSDMDIGPLSTAFEVLNMEGNGVLYVKDIVKGLQSDKTRGQYDPAMESLIENLDTNGDGAIDYVEFIAASMEQDVYMQKDFCMKAFKVFDLEGRGVITRENMRKVFQCDMRRGEFSDDFVEEIFNEVDLDRDGVINYTDFCTMLYGLSRPGDVATLD